MRVKGLAVKPIGIIHSPFKEVAGTPIQPSTAEGARGSIEVFRQYEEGLKDLEGFGRIWLVYWFDRAREMTLTVVPFKDTQERGLFATRAPCRPNPIGISAVKLLGIRGNIVDVGDIDIVEGTPLLDIKPYVPEFDRYNERRKGWFTSARKRAKADDRFAAKVRDRK